MPDIGTSPRASGKRGGRFYSYDSTNKLAAVSRTYRVGTNGATLLLLRRPRRWFRQTYPTSEAFVMPVAVERGNIIRGDWMIASFASRGEQVEETFPGKFE